VGAARCLGGDGTWRASPAACAGLAVAGGAVRTYRGAICVGLWQQDAWRWAPGPRASPPGQAESKQRLAARASQSRAPLC
jgi:hypothetical protein